MVYQVYIAARSWVSTIYSCPSSFHSQYLRQIYLDNPVVKVHMCCSEEKVEFIRRLNLPEWTNYHSQGKIAIKKQKIWVGWVEVTGVSDFFNKNPNLKYFFFGEGPGGGGGGGGLEKVNFYIESKSQ